MNKSHANATLQQLLTANKNFALNAKGTTNHCPMALCALASLGASSERLQEFFTMWQQQFAITVPTSFEHAIKVNRDNWHSHLGNPAAFSALSTYFEQWISDSEVDAVLVDFFKRIPFAPASGAFHGVIRLGYGLEAEHPGEIAAGLAALVCQHLPINISLEQPVSAVSVQDGLSALSRGMQGFVFKGDWIVTRLLAAAADSRFNALLLAPSYNGDLLSDMARAAIALYWQSNDFIALHIVTGLYATRRIFEHLPKYVGNQLLPDLWLGFCVAYASIGAPPLTLKHVMPISENDSAAWSHLHALAITSDNDHVIKMVYTCWREAQHASPPSPLYFAAAARLVQWKNER
ncbi:questin oxidase family protein [Glaciimonas soli]|uniref:DUF4243 domain-containing protein n=1 Tax=Glaciimonas soli TaxID=2590999 RepID=A0A843YYX8_9BURK|nr:questin oxidase family protein [Glaciimonas soli]MQR02678.1 DUF4243 domain-containing protein [Glaciimonas soli]